MDFPLISVIIPVYNVEEYLEECLNSIINQTYKHIEVIIINDGSTDNSYKVINEYANNYKNMKVINQKNAGQSVARNKGMEIAKGKYIYFLDSDDYILPETFDNLVQQLEKNNLDLIRFVARPFSDSFNKKVDVKEYDFRNYFEDGRVYNKAEFLSRNLKAFSPSPVLFMIKKEILIKNNLSFHPNIIHEDELFTLEDFFKY
ncbi:glycosyltransferase family 2 protein [Oceanobacillus caeni]|uniref:glycosyltransferase family 2 protein n=1 Tax=Oceanobacillus caeni TaxID=405946 RepID=UPI000761F58F|nr:glycosyltransferase [Oceanobacillus caeni]